jgi:hypothetical protein
MAEIQEKGVILGNLFHISTSFEVCSYFSYEF